MEKPFAGNYRILLWFVFLSANILFLLFLSIDYSSTISTNHVNGHVESRTDNAYVESRIDVITKQADFEQNLNPKSDVDLCLGRYIYLHDLPAQFNDEVLKNCHLLTRKTDKFDMCQSTENFGFGPQIEKSYGVLSNTSWFSTNQFLLEVIFHNRMKKYECLTNDSSIASAIFVPFYAGLDLRRYLWGFKASVRDSSGLALVKWLAEKPEWKKMWGRDHFLVAGRISRDFRRQSDSNSDWGSKFRFLPESENISMISIESSSWNNDFAIPYPTYFHPSKDSEVSQWQDRMRWQKREYLFSFAGAPRSRHKGSIRANVIDQCKTSSKSCKFLDCSDGANNCDDPVNVMKVFESSAFCIQPPGDSLTRRSIFDSMLAGCIPVFLDPGSAYTQYTWHLPKNYSKYSVFIPGKLLRDKKFRIEERLLQVSKEEEIAMREEVINLIPSIIYADSKSKLERVEDAFDLAVQGILERIETIRKVE
ncbi:probable xyloglucan galactosyltransferase GT14 [Pistacia vera]|uniref:probable xyloglucan galactosyltransferase GT14 n=1 Tax=Pistacia vera TaxID=55513 RepID=UPI001263E491|nr:probable xyloglucan galactosyltransferase GT14 [Pistacia vera]